MNLKALLMCLALVGLGGGAQAAEPPALTFELAQGSPQEVHTRDQMQRLLATHDLRRWIVTDQVRVEEGVIPHSHPVLTLSTRHRRDDDLLLATFVHEQMHWWLAQHRAATEAAERELRRLYPKIPVGYPQGSSSEEVNYEHLIIGTLERRAMIQLLGELRARQVMEFWSQDHYTWIYRQVQQDWRRLEAVIEQHGLWPA